MTSEKPDTTKEQLRRARRVALVLATSTAISIILLVYAFIKKDEADYQFERAEQFQQEAAKQRAIAESCYAEAMRARKNAEELSAQLGEQISEQTKNKK